MTSYEARVETTHNDGSPETLRDENGGLWLVVTDAADGTLAVDEIPEYGGGPTVPHFEQRPTIRPGVARWHRDGLTIYPVRDVGENHTDPARYEIGNGEMLIATPTGWEWRDETWDDE